MRKLLILLCPLLSVQLYSQIDYFNCKEKIDAISTDKAYKQFIDRSEQVQDTSQNLSLEEALSRADKCRLNAQTDKAIEYYKTVLTHEPTHFNACFNLGNIYYNKEQPEQALFYYQHGLESSHKAPQFYYNIGLCCKQLNKLEDALEYFTKAIELKSDYLKAYGQLAKVFQEKGEHNNALELLHKALDVAPDEPLLHRLLGTSYRSIEDFESALKHLRIAYELQPKEITIMLELANLLTMRGFLDEAFGIYQKILILHPNATTAFYNIAYVLKRQGYVNQAIEILQSIIKKNPDHTQAHLSLGLCYLTVGNFDEGWKEYEWRWETTKGRIPRIYPKPVWDGSELYGKTILVIAEQGLGDTFQFIRYAKLLKEMGARVIFKSRPELVTILSLCDYIDEIITSKSETPEFDVHIPLMSIPLVLKTDEKSIPAQIPYLKADSDLVKLWKNRLSNDNNFKIGICWQGNANYSTQFLRSTVAAKSMNIKFFEPLAKIPGVSLYSLQKVFGTEQLKELDNSVIIHDLGPDFDNDHGRFMDTAAVIKNLDLIITVDTSISHFAAALGAPTWIILPEPADWRWMLKRNDTPWYPNVRLFRQPRIGDWTAVIQNIIDALSTLLASHSHSPAYQTNSNLDGICDLEQRDIPQTKVVEPAANFEAMSLDEFVDKMTLAALANSNDYNNQKLLDLYNKHIEQWPQLKEYAQQLLHTNRYLLQLQKKIDAINSNVLDPDFSEIAEHISHAIKFKASIKQDIASLCKSTSRGY